MSKPTNSVRCLWVFESSALNTVTLLKEINSKWCFKVLEKLGFKYKILFTSTQMVLFSYHYTVLERLDKPRISAFSWTAGSLPTLTVMQ